jgi:hypothetical protein
LTTVIDSLILTAAGSIALPRLIGTALLPRVLGLYLATCAGAIQLLDITVDRFALDDRFFTFAIILAVLGIPCAGAGAILAEAARSERRPRHTGPSAGDATTDESRTVVSATPRTRSSDAPDASDVQQLTEASRLDLPRRLELALSFRRIAELHSENGEEDEAAEYRARCRRELERLIEEIERLVESS